MYLIKKEGVSSTTMFTRFPSPLGELDRKRWLLEHAGVALALGL